MQEYSYDLSDILRFNANVFVNCGASEFVNETVITLNAKHLGHKNF